MKLSEMIGSFIHVSSLVLKKGGEHERVKLLGVEAGGIWIQSQRVTDAHLATLKKGATSKTIVFFLPYQQISSIAVAIDEVALSETSFGL